jgi:hypothetical protein
MYGADRKTHLKIVVVGLVCATVVAAIGVAARVDHSVHAQATAAAKLRPAGPVIKAGGPVEITGQVPTIR